MASFAAVFLTMAVLHPVSYASTPQGAALLAIYSTGAGARVERLNRAGRYATVLLRGAFIEDAPVSAPILVERFAFGWQALELLTFRCRLTRHNLGRRMEGLLLAQTPKPSDDSACEGSRVDVGPIEDVVALRRLSPGPLTPYVRVTGTRAVVVWYGAGGGRDFFEKHHGRWNIAHAER